MSRPVYPIALKFPAALALLARPALAPSTRAAWAKTLDELACLERESQCAASQGVAYAGSVPAVVWLAGQNRAGRQAKGRKVARVVRLQFRCSLLVSAQWMERTQWPAPGTKALPLCSS